MRRRDFLGAAGALGLSACAGARNMEQWGPGGEMPPWHMWGTSHLIDALPSAPANAPVIQTNQLVRINYNRPETWRFFFAVELFNVAPALAAAGTVNVFFDLILGVGRSPLRLQSFAFFSFGVPGGATVIDVQKYAVEVPSPVLNDNDPNLATTPIDHFSSQDVQCSARAEFVAAAGSNANLQLTAYFSPNVHIRPDWYRYGKPYEQFRGGEVGGK